MWCVTQVIWIDPFWINVLAVVGLILKVPNGPAEQEKRGFASFTNKDTEPLKDLKLTFHLAKKIKK